MSDDRDAADRLGGKSCVSTTTDDASFAASIERRFRAHSLALQNLNDPVAFLYGGEFDECLWIFNGCSWFRNSRSSWLTWRMVRRSCWMCMTWFMIRRSIRVSVTCSSRRSWRSFWRTNHRIARHAKQRTKSFPWSLHVVDRKLRSTFFFPRLETRLDHARYTFFLQYFVDCQIRHSNGE